MWTSFLPSSELFKAVQKRAWQTPTPLFIKSVLRVHFFLLTPVRIYLSRYSALGWNKTNSKLPLDLGSSLASRHCSQPHPQQGGPLSSPSLGPRWPHLDPHAHWGGKAACQGNGRLPRQTGCSLGLAFFNCKADFYL